MWKSISFYHQGIKELRWEGCPPYLEDLDMSYNYIKRVRKGALKV